MVKGTKKGTTSAANGSFEIDANKGDKLVISSIGGACFQEVVVSTIDNIIISLAVNSLPLDEVQVIAYGTNSQRFSTGNVSVAKSSDIAKQPVSQSFLLPHCKGECLG